MTRIGRTKARADVSNLFSQKHVHVQQHARALSGISYDGLLRYIHVGHILNVEFILRVTNSILYDISSVNC